MQDKKLVLGIGDLVVDVIVEIGKFPINSDNFYSSSNIALNVGGRCNFLITLSRLNVNTAAIDVIGDDIWGEFLCGTLYKENIDISLIQKNKETSKSIVLCSRDIRHSFIGKLANNSEYKFDEEYRTSISNANAVFASGYNFHNPNSGNLVIDAFNLAKQHDLVRGFDAGPIFKSIDDLTRQKIIELCTHFFITEEELNELDVNDPAEFLKTGLDVLVIKRGKNGCKVVTSNHTFSVQGLKVPVVDTTAAGDCFDAGFIAGLIKKLPLERCAELANCVGAATVSKLGGGINTPTSNEIQRIANKHNFNFDFNLVF